MEGAGRSTYTHVKRPGQIFMSFLGPILPHLFGVSNFSNAFVPVHTITSPLQKMYVVSVKKKKRKIDRETVIGLGMGKGTGLIRDLVCWKEMCTAGFVLGRKLDSLMAVAERRPLNRLLSILDKAHHPLHSTVTRQSRVFSGRPLSQSCSTDRLRKTFVCQATLNIQLLPAMVGWNVLLCVRVPLCCCPCSPAFS